MSIGFIIFFFKNHDSKGQFTVKSICIEDATIKACFLSWADAKGKVPIEICLRGEIVSWLVDVLCISRRKNRRTNIFVH